MPGNESDITAFLLKNKGKLSLRHLGVILSVKNPGNDGKLLELKEISDLRADNARKKADIFLNDSGVSIKQSGSSFLYNRLQRADMAKLFRALNLADEAGSLNRLDEIVRRNHSGAVLGRDRPWREVFSEGDFKKLLKFLMMDGSPNTGVSQFKADYILSAPSHNISEQNIRVSTFEEFFNASKDHIFLTIRHQWVGQSSNSEHGRAVSISRKTENAPWVFEEITGEPRSGWQPEELFPKNSRREVYMIFIQLIEP